MTRALFAQQGEGFTPLDLARGYWKHDSLHGRALVGLLGYELDRRHGGEGFVPARLNVDMFELAPFGHVTVNSRVVKISSRLRLVEGDLLVDGRAVARGVCQILRAGEAPPGHVWSPGPWGAPTPESLSPKAGDPSPRIFEWRNIQGRMGEAGQKRLWARETHALIDGTPLTPYARITLLADFVSPYAHGGDAGIKYINTDVGVHLHRLPVGEWIGVETTGHEASSGIAVGHCRLHDIEGPIGFASCAALAHDRRRSMGAAKRDEAKAPAT